MSTHKALGFAAAALLLAGCASRLPDNEALIAPKTLIAVPPPEADGTVTVAQSIVARFRDHTFAFDAQIEMTPGRFDLVALDSLGRRALTVHWRSDGMDFDAAPWLPSVVRPADILADIAIVYGPEKGVAQSVARAGATLTETDTTRTISSAGGDLMIVDYGSGEGWNRSAKLRNLAFGYEIDIQSAEVAP